MALSLAGPALIPVASILWPKNPTEVQSKLHFEGFNSSPASIRTMKSCSSSLGCSVQDLLAMQISSKNICKLMPGRPAKTAFISF